MIPHLPLFAPLQPWLERLPDGPDTQALARLADEQAIETASGYRVRFVPPKADGLAYECRIGETGEVETRPDNWHDYFNGLVWLTFPQTKIALSAAHLRAWNADGAPRGQVRDALTHFDECGMVVLASDPGLLELLREFKWQALFVERRADVLRQMRFIVFGHATYEALLQPYHGLTAKAVLYEVDEGWLEWPLADQVRDVDRRLAADLAAGAFQQPRALQPLPLLGIPGMTPANEDPAYYADVRQFRPGRRARATPAAVLDQ